MTMKKIITTVAFLLFFVNSSDAYRYAVDSIPVNLRTNASAVIRTEQMVYSLLSPGRAGLKFKKAITLMNETAEDERVQYVYYDDFRSVSNIKAVVYDSKGKIVEVLGPSKILDISINSDFVSDARAKKIVFPLNKYPFTIEYEYESDLKGIINLQSWRFHESPDVSVEQSAVQYVIPENMNFRFRERYMTGKVDSIFSEGKKIYTWSEENIPAIKNWFFNPLIMSRSPYLLAATDNFEYADHQGSMKSWEEYGRWNFEIKKGLDQLPPEEKKRIHDVADGISDKLGKISALYKYMQSRTRYVSIQLGIGGIKPFSAEFVSENGYGDCKALTNYMFSILKEVDIESHYTLVKSGDNRDIITSFVCDQFDHIILCVPCEKDTVWLECTNQTKPFNFLGSFTSDRSVLLITPKGGVLARTPKMEDSYTQRRGLFNISRNEPVTGEISVRTGGSTFDKMNLGFAGKTETEIAKSLALSLPFGTYEVPSASYFENHEGNQYSVMTYSLKIRDFIVKSQSRIYFQPCINPFSYQPFDTINVRLFESNTERDSITYRLPVNFEAEVVPMSVNIENRFGKYRCNTTVSPHGALVYVREFVLKKGIYRDADAKELFGFLNTVAGYDQKRIVLKKKQSS